MNEFEAEEPKTITTEDLLASQLAAEINMVKKVSRDMLAAGDAKLSQAHHGDDIDKFMNTGEVEMTIADIDAKYK